MRLICAAAAAALLASCSSEPLQPAPLAFGQESCHACRMIIADRRFPAQIVAHGHEPQFFDDLGCLKEGLSRHAARDTATVFVSDYKNGGWIRADDAEYFRCPGMATPMNSGIIATAAGGTPTFCPSIDRSEILSRGATTR